MACATAGAALRLVFDDDLAVTLEFGIQCVFDNLPECGFFLRAPACSPGSWLQDDHEDPTTAAAADHLGCMAGD